MKITNRQFKPSFLMTFFYVLVGGCMLALGLWQLQRADEKIILQQAADFAAQRAPVGLEEAGLVRAGQINAGPLSADQVSADQVSADQVSAGDDSAGTRSHALTDSESISGSIARYIRVKLTGRFEPQRQLLWDNRVHTGRAGFEVITPFRLSRGRHVVLVNRGWVPAGPSRQQLPDVALDNPTEVSFIGLFTWPSIGFSGGDAVDLSLQEWPRVLQHFDYAQIFAAFGEPLMVPGLVQISRDLPVSGIADVTLYVDNWQAVAFGPERHYGYAFQWFAMFAALSCLYFILNSTTISTGKPS